MTKLPSQASLADFQTFIFEQCAERGWDDRTVLEKMLFMTEEVGEVAKAIRKDSGVYGYEKPKNTDHIAEELVDVFNYILDIANVYKIDLDSAFRSKWAANDTRNWQNGYGAKTTPDN